MDEEFKVVNEDTGETTPTPKLVKEGLRGEMCVKGPNLMLGYWPNPGDGLDDLLYEYPGVYEAAAIGVPDPDRPGSERIKAFIAPYPEYRGKIKEEDIIEYLKERVEKWAVPKSVEIRDELPKSPVEKIFKKQLREEEIEKMKKAGVLK